MPRRHLTLTIVLIGAMAASTFHLFAVGVLAADLRDELGLSNAQLGFVGAANTGLGALLSPRLGALSDRIGARNSVVILCCMSAVGLVMMGLATGMIVLLASAAISGPAQGWSNPATNKLIAERLEPSERGVITGFKQSGVQFASFLCGLTLPTAASAASWRLAVAALGVLSFGIAVLALTRLSTDSATAGDETSTTNPAPVHRGIDPFVFRVAIFAALFGLSTGGIFRFLPLFAHEELGFSTELAGLLIAVNGGLGVVARILWGRATERSIEPQRGLLIIGIASIVCVTGLAVSVDVGGWLLWPFTIASAFCLGAWNVVAMLAVIKTVPSTDAGRSTGFVILGFLGGLTVAQPLTGWSADATGSFTTAWWVLLAMTVLGTISMIGRRPDRAAEVKATAAQH